MHITELILETHTLAAQRDFYEHTLGLPVVAANDQAFTVQAGSTRLTFQETEQREPLYHVAFTIPRNKIEQAKQWAEARFPLVTDPAGHTEFTGGSWNSWSIYFRDPADNILEFIAHYDLPKETTGDFGPADILHVSEIGLPVDDVKSPGVPAPIQVTVQGTEERHYTLAPLPYSVDVVASNQ